MNGVHAVELPALDGRLPLGFLASLGLLSLLQDQELRARLSFSERNAAAVIHSPLGSLDEVAKALARVIENIPVGGDGADDALLPGVPPGWPPKVSGKDPLRCPRDKYRDLATQTRKTSPAAADHWLAHLVTDLAADKEGRAALTLLRSPAGAQTVETFLRKPLAAVRARPSAIREALAGWRRIEKFTGEYLDHQAIASAADHPRGKADASSGVPGATWLAIMSLPLLRLTGDGQHTLAALWHRAGRHQVMIWPLWRQPLTPRGLQVLIEHPCLESVNDPAPDQVHRAAPSVSLRNDSWERLGIVGVYAAARLRIPGQDYQRPLSPIPVQIVN
jgi:CRISPR-associated endonuclease/helicase Cas3